MKSEWHRYNLKRRVAELPPIDEDMFNSKFTALSVSESKIQNSDEKMSKKEKRRKEKEILQAKKREILRMAREAMISSTRQDDIGQSAKIEPESQEDISKPQLPLEGSLQENDAEGDLQEALLEEKISNRVEIPPTTCLFCHPKKNATFENIDSNIQHMYLSHGLYIPERKYLKDQEGLIKYLGEKIGLGNVCLCCSYQGRNLESVREHMRYKRHMRIPYETEDEKLEISEFYDFMSSYDAPQIINTESTEDDWEDVSSADDSDDDLEEVVDPYEGALFVHNKELHLPSGAVAGHRSLQRYYKQNLPPERVLSEGQGTVVAAETRHMYRLADKKELSTKKRMWSRQKKREDINDRRAAKFINNQPHYRDQLLQ